MKTVPPYELRKERKINKNDEKPKRNIELFKREINE